MKIMLIDRLSFWHVLASTGRKTLEVGTMMKHKGETEKQATPRGVALWEERKEELTKNKESA